MSVSVRAVSASNSSSIAFCRSRSSRCSRSNASPMVVRKLLVEDCGDSHQGLGQGERMGERGKVGEGHVEELGGRTGWHRPGQHMIPGAL